MASDSSTNGSTLAAGTMSAARWLTAAAGGILASSVAGLQLVGLGDARSPRLAVTAFVVIFVAASVTIWAGSRVLLPAYDGLHDLSSEQTAMRLEIVSSPGRTPTGIPEIEQFGYLNPLYRHLASLSARSPEQLLEARRQATEQTEAAAHDARIVEMLGMCNAWQARRRFREMLRWLAAAGAATLVAVPVYAIASTGGDTPRPTIDTAIGALVLFDTVPNPIAGASCVNEPFEALLVGGTFASPLARVTSQHGCRAGTVRLDPEDSYTLIAD